MGVPDRSAPGFIEVRAELRNGGTIQFEISEEILEDLDRLREHGLRGAELCSAWFGSALPSEGLVTVTVAGHRVDGTRVDIAFECASRDLWTMAPPPGSQRISRAS